MREATLREIALSEEAEAMGESALLAAIESTSRSGDGEAWATYRAIAIRRGIKVMPIEEYLSGWTHTSLERAMLFDRIAEANYNIQGVAGDPDLTEGARTRSLEYWRADLAEAQEALAKLEAP